MNIRDDLVRYYYWLRQYGYNDSHSGNASVRDSDKIWVTPTGACADTLAPEDLLACTIDGTCARGASVDALLHIRVYQQNPSAGAVLHSHGPYSVSVTLQGEDFAPVDYEGQLYFPRVPVITISYDDYLRESPHRVAAMLTNYPITVVRGHGVYAQGETLNIAYKWTCSLEQSAKTAYLARQAGTIG